MAMTKSSGALSGDRRVRRTRAALQRALIDLVEERDLAHISVADVVERADVNRSTFYAHYQDVHELAEAACTSMIDDLIGVVLTLDPALPIPPDPSDAPSSSGDQGPSEAPGPAGDHGPAEDPDPPLTAFFAHFAEHAGLYRSLLGPTGSARVIEHVRLRTTAAAHSSGQLPDTNAAPPPDTASPSDRQSGTPSDLRSGTSSDVPSGIPHDVPAAFVAGALLGVATDWLRRGCPGTPAELTILTKPLLRRLSAGG
ncbi:TetR/AcrR family transcriptional regulator [Streptomyces sp. NPDC002643]